MSFLKYLYLILFTVVLLLLISSLIDAPTFYDLPSSNSTLPERVILRSENDTFQLNWNNSKNLLEFLNSLSSNQRNSGKFLLNPLKEVLFNENSSDLNILIDNYLILTLWTFKLNALEEAYPHYSMDLNTIKHFWYNEISNGVSHIVELESDKKFDYRIYLITRVLNSESYYPAFKNSILEKITLNLVQGNFGYILNRFWIGTSLLIKIIFLIVFLINIYVYYEFIKKFF